MQHAYISRTMQLQLHYTKCASVCSSRPNMVSNSKAESLPLSLWAFFRQDPEPMVTWTQPRERQRTTTCMEGTSKYVLISSIIHYKSKY